MSRLNFPPSSRRAAALVAVALWPHTAAAHSVLGVSRWWDGALHTLVSPLSVAAVLALAAATCRMKQERSVGLIFAAAVGAFAGSALTPMPYSALIGPAGAVLAGMSAALTFMPGLRTSAILSALIGFSAGVAASPDERLTLEMAAGSGLLVLVLGANAYFAIAWLARLEPVVPRVLGAWCGAIGLMMGLLAIAQ